MAPSKVTEIPGDLELLKSVYDALRSTSKQLESVDLDIFHLLSFQWIQDGRSDEERRAASQLLTQHRRVAFGNQDPWGLHPDQSGQWVEHHRAVIQSPEVANHYLDKAKTSKVALEDIQNALRGSANRLSRPFLRNLTILDLPDEILVEVFAYFDPNNPVNPSRHPYECWYPSEDIQALRFVCRRISGIASHLLLRVINLDLQEESSLKRLEDISRHPTIAKGVHALNINLEFYNHAFFHVEDYLAHYAYRAEEDVNTFERCRLWELNGTSEEAAVQLITKGKELVTTLHRLLSPGERTQDDQRQVLYLLETHELYMELLERQVLRLQGDKLYRAVGAAMARMPCARSLIFDDFLFLFRGSKARPLMSPGVDMWESLRSQMLAPVNGYTVKKDHLDPPSLQCVSRLIDAGREFGVSLHHLEIKLSSLSRSMDLVPPPDSRPLFSSGMQQLRTFTFKCDSEDPTNGQDDGEEEDGLVDFISACLDTSSLQSLWLDLRGRGSGQHHSPLRLKDIFNRKRSINKLNHLSLHGFALNFTDLVTFIKRLPKGMTCLSLYDIDLDTGSSDLDTGSWREALDVFREQKPAVMLLKGPSGAECEDMTEEEYKRLFKTEICGYRTEAEAYVRGIFRNNPISAQ
ncbi:hypothetical protein QBC34DRAFT_411049 [Podospora aff. communis PSN243]|uniref:F-box domain-containing protein n=1 Tax=Podospora aff. communis PSN243 TaxID=3040156 RepID=A0AAV9GEG9_9PEZI|nr:hypothetical protein QBC34DRAFT_411049 [Podospora aff. communis PSN243]